MQARLSELAGFSLAAGPEGTAMRRVLDLAVGCLPASDGAGITIAANGGFRAGVDTDVTTTNVDALQHETGEGPCTDAIRTGQRQHTDSITSEARWPRFTRLARTHGIQSCLALPLEVRDRPFAALNLYSRSARAFAALTPDTADAVTVLASAAMANAVAYEDSRRFAEHLAALLATTDDTIAQAQGILMERGGGDAQAALTQLDQEAARRGHTHDDVARTIIASTRPAQDGGK